ncbi:MAG: methyltransferase domain-containing protein [Clostridiaceae bacterium]|nr:methyltransferase domain-containing protein [Clostridiaceae bacterium]
MLDSTGFDLWANGYDKSVNHSEKNNEYHFAGYNDLLNYIYNQVRIKDDANVLDIRFGTGILTTQLYNNGYSITGIDFSSNMIDIAKQKMPQRAGVLTIVNTNFI